MQTGRQWSSFVFARTRAEKIDVSIKKLSYYVSVIFAKKYFKLLAAFVLLPAVVFLSIFSLDEKGFFKIDKIEINATALASQKNYITPKIALLKEKLDTFKGVSLWRFPLSKVAAILKDEAWVKDYRLSRAWPSSLVIELDPQAIAFLIQETSVGQNATEFHPVTQTGQILEKIDSKQTPNTIVIRDNLFLKNQKIREGALKVLNSLPTQGRLHPSQISEIGYDKKEGYWIRLIQSEMKINLGEDQYEIKSARVAQVIDYLENRDLKARVIDANLSKKVLVRMH